MKRSFLLSLVLAAAFFCASCANQGNAPDASAANQPVGVGTATETGTANLGGVGAGAGAGLGGGH